MPKGFRGRRRDIADGITKADVDLAIEEWKQIGMTSFHAKYTTNKAERYVIVDIDGAEYPAKAILMAARTHAGLDGINSEFRGERETVEGPLMRMGYLVEDLTDRDYEEYAATETTSPVEREKVIDLAKRYAGRTEVKALRSGRREQRTLRWALGLGTGNNQCSICGRLFPDRLLIAAHIKKRSECSDSERIDIPAVAFIACSLGCDVLFEHGYIGVDENQIIVPVRSMAADNSQLSEIIKGLIGKQINGVTEKSDGYFSWHRSYWQTNPH
jgi:hypothetical protein